MIDPNFVPRGLAFTTGKATLVFAGKDPDHPDKVFLCFRNDRNIDTKMILDREAALLLRHALRVMDRYTLGAVCPPNPREEGPVTWWVTATDLAAKQTWSEISGNGR